MREGRREREREGEREGRREWGKREYITTCQTVRRVGIIIGSNVWYDKETKFGNNLKQEQRERETCACQSGRGLRKAETHYHRGKNAGLEWRISEHEWSLPV